MSIKHIVRVAKFKIFLPEVVKGATLFSRFTTSSKVKIRTIFSLVSCLESFNSFLSFCITTYDNRHEIYLPKIYTIRLVVTTLQVEANLFHMKRK
jgi:hypothetical protein